MWVLASPRGARHHTGPANLFGIASGEWRRVNARGADVSGVWVADDHPGAAELRKVVSGVPGHWVAEDVEVLDGPPAPPPPPPPAPTADEQIHERMTGLALRNGWEPEDLRGTWDGRPDSERANRSPSTGLTLLEMAQTTMPADWPRIRDLGQAPWSSSAWREPFPGWAPPLWHKAPTVAVPAPVVPEFTPLDEAVTVLMDAPVMDDDPTTLSVDAPVDTMGEFDFEATYPEGSEGAARAVLQALALEIGKPPTLAKANHRLARNKLPKLTDESTLKRLLQPEV